MKTPGLKGLRPREGDREGALNTVAPTVGLHLMQERLCNISGVQLDGAGLSTLWLHCCNPVDTTCTCSAWWCGVELAACCTFCCTLVKSSTAAVDAAPMLAAVVAGITRDSLMMRMKPDQWQDVIDTNLSSVFYATQVRLQATLSHDTTPAPH